MSDSVIIRKESKTVPMIFLPLAPCSLPLKLEDVEHPKLNFFRFSGRVDGWTVDAPTSINSLRFLELKELRELKELKTIGYKEMSNKEMSNKE